MSTLARAEDSHQTVYGTGIRAGHQMAVQSQSQSAPPAPDLLRVGPGILQDNRFAMQAVAFHRGFASAGCKAQCNQCP
jgi:hypothetical protein